MYNAFNTSEVFYYYLFKTNAYKNAIFTSPLKSVTIHRQYHCNMNDLLLCKVQIITLFHKTGECFELLWYNAHILAIITDVIVRWKL